MDFSRSVTAFIVHGPIVPTPLAHPVTQLIGVDPVSQIRPSDRNAGLAGSFDHGLLERLRVGATGTAGAAHESGHFYAKWTCWFAR